MVKPSTVLPFEPSIGEQDRHAERDAELARHAEDAAARGVAGRGEIPRGRCGQRRDHEPDADAADDHAGQVVAGEVRRRRQLRDPPQPAESVDQRARDGHGARADPLGEQAGGHREEAGHQRAGRDHQARGQDVLVPDPGQEQDRAEQHRAEGGEEHERRRVAERERAVLEQLELDDGRVVGGRAADEGGQEDRRRGQRGDEGGRAPAPLRGLDEREREPGHAGHEQHDAEQVGPRAAGGVADLLEEADRDVEHHEADGEVDEEDPVPARLHEQAADRRAGRGRDRAGRRPDRHRAAALLGRERGEHERQRRGQERGGAGGLQGAGGDEQGDGVRRGAQDGGEQEDGQAADEDALAPDEVGQAAERDEQRGDDDRIGVQHPRQRGVARPREALLDVREGDVDDEEVEAREEGRHGGDREHAVAVGHGKRSLSVA